jgi:hypothetical protein
MSCHKTQETNGTDSNALLWESTPISPEREISNPSAMQLKTEGFQALGPLSLLPQRFLSLNQGALKLLQFGGDAAAYAAFQRLADPTELAEGFAERQDTLFFRKGPWLGELTGFARGEEGLHSKLQLPGDENWGDLPEAFASLLHQGRLDHSERVITDFFLGLPVPVPVFAARFDCHGDSAWVYSSPDMPLYFVLAAGDRPGYHLDSIGAEKIVTSIQGSISGLKTSSLSPPPSLPLRLDYFGSGMAAVEGCFDDSLTLHWVEIQKKALKSLKLGHS